MMDEHREDLREPFLLVHGTEHAERSKQALQPPCSITSRWQSTTSFLDCTFNLAKVITGAGMMAIPRAYTQIGSVLGTGMLLGVAVLTYWTLAVLITASSRTGAQTYPQLVSVMLGPGVAKVLQVAVLCFCAGFNVVYLVVIKDILLGTPPHCNGLLCEVFGVANIGPWSNPAYIICGVALACAPFLMLKSMDKLSFLNIIGVAATVLLAAAAAGLGLLAILQGTAYPIPLLPQWQLLGPTTAAQFEALTDVLPVILACYVAHQSLHPLMPQLKPYSPARMCGVVASALALVASIFWMLSVGGAIAFGPNLDINALKNFTQEGMAPFVGVELARILSWAIRGGYLIALLANLLLYMHPLRSYIAEIVWPERGTAVISSEQHIEQGRIGTDAAVGAAAEHEVENRDSVGIVVCCEGGSPSSASTSSMASCDTNESGVCSSNAAALNAATAGVRTARPEQQGAPAAAGPTEQLFSVVAVPAAAVGVVKDAAAAAGSSSTAVGELKPLLRWQRNEQRWYYPMTYGLLVLLTLLAILVPNIWLALSAIGDLASTLQAFVVPGLIALALAAAGSKTQPWTAVSITPAVHAGSADGYSEQPLQQGLLNVEDGSILQSKKGLTFAAVQQLLYTGMGWFVVLLGSALFANGIWQRV